MVDFSSIRADLEKYVKEVGTVAREVVAKRVAVIAAVTVALNLLVSYGVIAPDLSSTVLRWVAVPFDVAAAVAAIFVVRVKVTPLNSPKDASGEPLVPVSAALAQVEKVVNEVRAEYADVKKGDVSNAAQTVQDVADTGKALVKDVQTDVQAVVAPVENALHPNQ